MAESDTHGTGEQGHRRFPVVCVGASAGGLEAFTQFVRALPRDTGMAFVLIQHLDPSHASHLPAILSRDTDLPLREAAKGMPVAPNHIYVMPAGMDLVLSRGILDIVPRKDPPGTHRPIDTFMRSLAEDQGPSAIGVVLSGTASDGTLGLEEIKAAGGITFAQDSTALHDGMPRSAIEAGVVDFILPPDAIAREIATMSRHPYLGAIPAPTVDAQPAGIAEVLATLHQRMGVDFTHYKSTTLYRRITRRMILRGLEGLDQYVKYVQDDPGEVDALFQDVLISVTSFFRDPDAFEALKIKAFPRLFQDRSRHDPLRVWVLGCSTGEEAYSLAIAATEVAEANGWNVPLQIFATDLNAAGIEKARAGFYSKNVLDDVSPERLGRFFVPSEGGYRIAKSIRERCIFARHNVLAEPPFSRMDMVSCRNLLIYLGQDVQQRVIQTLHYALKSGGALWLGSSETIGSYHDLFALEDAKHKIYFKLPFPTRVAMGFPGGRHAQENPTLRPGRTKDSQQTVDSYREADRILLSKYAPASVLISREFDILQFRGDTGPFLAPAPGKASLNLLKMLREGLLVGVRAAVHKALKQEGPARAEGLRVESNGAWREVVVEVVPVAIGTARAALLMVVFEDTSAGQGAAPRPSEVNRGPEEDLARENERLRQELAATREYLQSLIEQQEAINEELQSANEEVQSSNEELQSINEELETSKEEIQSSNEELATVNEELHHRNSELGQMNDDLVNLLGSVQMAIVMLGADLCIRRFTPPAEKLFNLVPGDVGQPMSDIKLNIDIPDLDTLVREVIATARSKDLELVDREGRWHLLRIDPYRTVDNRIDGVVIVLVDVDSLKRSEVLRRQNELLEQAHEPIFIWELDGGITYWNRAAEEVYGYTKEQVLGRTSYELLATSPAGTLLKQILKRDGRWSGDLVHTRRDGQKIIVESHMVLVREAGGRDLVVEANRPITERKQTEQILRSRADDLVQADRHKDEFLAMLAHELRNPLAPLRNIVEVLRAPTTDDATRDHAMEIMDRQIHNMARLIDDLLDVSRITLGRIQLRIEPVRLDIIVQRAVDQIQSRLDAKGQTLSLSLPKEPIYLSVDMVRMDQILGNLLNNASKFTERGRRIWLAAERAAERVIIRVRDEGMGIEATALPLIFDLFMRATRSVEHGGLGIGLTLVRRLAELHGGSVEARSGGRGAGSEFIVSLPRLEHVPPMTRNRTGTTELPAAPEEGRRILVIDDNVDSAETSAMLLRSVNHDVRTAHDGPSGLREAESFRPELVLLDIGLPGMSGYEVAQELRGLPGLAGTVIVAVTGYGEEDSRRRAREASMDHFLTKPMDLDRIYAIIAELPEPED